ncbi:aminoglycoside phosphotransferase [Sphingobium sp. TA15]|uniref:Putative aminoglycoside phosphotransferase n=1 Tax=Sphingobium indicum (strain DSM 16413 / CCM 7287 / MTCC 6362 / UT26 / NBRC 101211 / UT26S) TaxID=452662 RepID=D4Z0V0_SPHIU|nr:phosphotransferase [Sphingobium indicum]BAI96232.1 putative aminoglycoside phosphotransferase [Sphingobium indicum UT26S]BDD65532.1 aminoglycoside phosphotransferase [Sphingobium sp. TA15]
MFDLDAQTGTTPVRDAHRFDEAALAHWMADHIADFEGPIQLEQFKGGQSNPTYVVRTPSRSYVLRRKPPGVLLKGAHAIQREARVIGAVGAAGLPVPTIFGLCTDDNVIGTWFYVMELVEGRIFWDATFPDVPAADRPAYFDAMNATIAGLHTIDHRAAGLGDYGREGGFFARQIALWTRQYLADEDAGRDPAMDRLVEWLPTAIPADDRSCLAHGDFRVDNLIFHPDEPKVIAVLDWELSTIGNPLADFGYHLMMYHMPPVIVPGLVGHDLPSLNIPSESDYVASYCRRMGLKNLSGLDFSLAFNLFRFAAIVHGVKGRYLRGNAANADAKQRADAFPEMAALAWNQARRAGAT